MPAAATDLFTPSFGIYLQEFMKVLWLKLQTLQADYIKPWP